MQRSASGSTRTLERIQYMTGKDSVYYCHGFEKIIIMDLRNYHVIAVIIKSLKAAILLYFMANLINSASLCTIHKSNQKTLHEFSL